MHKDFHKGLIFLSIKHSYIPSNKLRILCPEEDQCILVETSTRFLSARFKLKSRNLSVLEAIQTGVQYMYVHRQIDAETH